MSVIERITPVPDRAEAPLRYERLASRHIEPLLTIELEAYPDPWTEGMFRQELLNGSSYFFVVFQGEQLVGYGGFWYVVDEAHITKVTTAAPFRRKGIATELLFYLLHRGREAGATTARLEVRESNEEARLLYEKFGFGEVGLRKGYYRRTGESAVVMVKRLC